MSPQSGTAIFAVNNQPFLYGEKYAYRVEKLLESAADGDILKVEQAKIERSPRLAELFLLKALSVARTHSFEYPWDVVQCLVNIGTLYFKIGQYDKSKSHFQEALTRARLIRGDEHLASRPSLLQNEIPAPRPVIIDSPNVRQASHGQKVWFRLVVSGRTVEHIQYMVLSSGVIRAAQARQLPPKAGH